MLARLSGPPAVGPSRGLGAWPSLRLLEGVCVTGGGARLCLRCWDLFKALGFVRHRGNKARSSTAGGVQA